MSHPIDLNKSIYYFTFFKSDSFKTNLLIEKPITTSYCSMHLLPRSVYVLGGLPTLEHPNVHP